MSFKLRAPRIEDAEALAELFNRASAELGDPPEISAEDLATWMTAPDVNLETDARIAVEGGRLTGAVDVMAQPLPKFWIDCRVLPSESDALREALLDWAEERTYEWASGQEDAVARFYTSSKDEQTRRAVERRGYRLIRHSYRMRIDFDEEPAEPDWPDGISVRPATPEDFRALHEAHQESFQDSWESHPEPFEEWCHWMTGYPTFDPSLWFVAEDGGKIAGFSLCKPHDAEEDVGWVRLLGVRRPWRGRGLGRALLVHSFGEFWRRGFHAVALGVDASSLTGANRLYENAGMRVVKHHDIFEKQLAG